MHTYAYFVIGAHNCFNLQIVSLKSTNSLLSPIQDGSMPRTMLHRCKATYELFVTAFHANARELLGEAMINDCLAPITKTLTPLRC